MKENSESSKSSTPLRIVEESWVRERDLNYDVAVAIHAIAAKWNVSPQQVYEGYPKEMVMETFMQLCMMRRQGRLTEPDYVHSMTMYDDGSAGIFSEKREDETLW